MVFSSGCRDWKAPARVPAAGTAYYNTLFVSLVPAAGTGRPQIKSRLPGPDTGRKQYVAAKFRAACYNSEFLLSQTVELVAKKSQFTTASLCIFLQIIVTF